MARQKLQLRHDKNCMNYLRRRSIQAHEQRAFFSSMERVESTTERGGERTQELPGDRQGPVTGRSFAARTFQMGFGYGGRPDSPDPRPQSVRQDRLCGWRRHTDGRPTEPGDRRAGFQPAYAAVRRLAAKPAVLPDSRPHSGVKPNPTGGSRPVGRDRRRSRRADWCWSQPTGSRRNRKG